LLTCSCSRLADWDEDDVSVIPATSARWDRVVILKHIFTLEELEGDPELIEEIEDDTREECSKFGDVENVVLFDREPSGVISVRFSHTTAAKACVRKMHGRAYERRTLEAKISNGTERFQKTARGAEN
jgi:HIV Tat-specific factor 1